MKIFHSLVFLCAPVLLVASAVGADDHSQHGDDSSAHSHMGSASPLTAAGNYEFWTIQEAIQELDADPKTDWTKVNVEALRQHLVDMHNFTINVDVLSQKAIEKGMEAVVRPTTKGSEASLDRVFAAHPAQLKREAGWDMQVKKKGDLFTLRVTTNNPAEVNRIRGLGYIGVMALGEHHQIHHWGLVKGENPHH